MAKTKEKGAGYRVRGTGKKITPNPEESLQQQVVSAHHSNDNNGMIPPVKDSSRTPSPDEGRRKLITWLWRLPVLAVVGGAGYAVYEAYFHLNRLTPTPTPTFTDGEAQKIADVSDFTDVWDSVEFTYVTPSILVRLPKLIPGGIMVDDKHFAAFTRICTHQGCIVNLNKNLEAVAVAFNYRSDEPVLSCQCHFSVFDLDLAGKAVSGPAVKPLPRIRLEHRNNALYATGTESQRY